MKAITGLQADGTSAITLTSLQEAVIAAGFSIEPSQSNTNNGSIDWSYSISEPAIRFLDPDETITAVFTVVVSDGQGGVATQDVTITIEGFDDRDGLSADSEEQLSNLVAQTTGGTPGDLNGDGIPDARQPEVATLAWILADYFKQGLAGTLTEIRPIISISAMDGSEGMATSPAYQLQNIQVLAEDEINLDAASRYKPDGPEIIQAPWDPIQFSVTPGGDAIELVDADPSQAGLQVRLYIDISHAQMAEDDFNAYYKYVSNDALIGYAAMGLSLVDLDGRPITAPGWYDFTQRVVGGDGARFVIENGQIIGIEINITDNAFGDNDPTPHRIDDPGLPVKIGAVPSTEETPSVVTTPSIPELPPITATPTITATTPIPTNSSEANVDADASTSPSSNPSQADGSGRGGSGRTPWGDRMAQHSRDAVMHWALKGNLSPVNGRATDQQNPVGNPAAVPDRADGPIPTNALLLNNLGPNLLDVLALGGAGLFCTQPASGRGWKQWQRWWWGLPLLTGFSWLAAAGLRQSIATVFAIEGSGQRAKLVAAAVQHDGIDILAEQPILLDAPPQSDWRELDLTAAINQLLDRVKEDDQRHFDLLLLDPQLIQHRKQLGELADEQALLRHPSFQESLLRLNAADSELLRTWLNRPSQTDLLSSEGCKAVSAQLANLQSHWSEYMGQEQANVAGVLELSIALSNRQPLYAVI